MGKFKVKLTLLLLFAFPFNSFCQNEQTNKQIVQRYFEEVINRQKLELLSTIYSDEYVFKSLGDGSETRGIKQLQEFLPYFFKAFPDIRYTIDQIVSEGDRVAVQVTAKGTHKAEFWGNPASGNKIAVSEFFFFTVKAGKIVENRGMVDLYHLFDQLKGTK